MTIEVNEIRRVFRYNGITLPDLPGMSPREIRDLYSAQYPELISAEIEAGEIADGTQEYTFRKAVGTKGRTGSGGDRLATLKALVEFESAGGDKLAQVLPKPATQKIGTAWAKFSVLGMRQPHARHGVPLTPTSDMLAPLP
jgi:PRTRC genetic system protein C